MKPFSAMLSVVGITTLIALLGVPTITTVETSTAVFYVATDGNDNDGDGSPGNPWATITHAVETVPDGSTILVQPGTYHGRVRLDEVFDQGILIRSEIPYQAKLRHSGNQVLTCFYGSRITLEGFDIAHSPENSSALVIQIQDLLGVGPGIGDDGLDPVVSYITLRDNIIHDSTNNDLLKINNGARNITVDGNMFFNQYGSDEHMDINSVVDITVQDNIFFNYNPADIDTGSFVLVKDSNGDSDDVEGSERVTVRRNIFLNWYGSTGSNFLLLGEDGNAYYEAIDILAENNLMIGNSPNMIRAAFGVKGGRDVVFRNNTVVGDLPSRSYAMRLNTEGGNPPNDNIRFYNNIWSDPAGSMGTEANSTADFAEVPDGQNLTIELDNNLYWNGVNPIPFDDQQMIQYTDDLNRIIGDPSLGNQAGLVVPHWNGSAFADGSISIREAFERLVNLFGAPAAGSPAVDAADPSHAPVDDILGAWRGSSPDIGAYERDTLTPHYNFLPLITSSQ